MIFDQAFLNQPKEVQYAESRLHLLTAVRSHAVSLMNRVLPLRAAREFSWDHWQTIDRVVLVEVLRSLDVPDATIDRVAFRKALFVKALVELTIMTGDQLAQWQARMVPDQVQGAAGVC